MKRLILILSVITFMTGVILIGCASDQKDETTEVKTEDGKTDVVIVEDDANTVTIKTANAEEWKLFKAEAQLKIRENEIRIAELKAKKQKPGKLFDELREKRIKNLELKNSELRARITTYETTQSDWEKFKQEFNHDMDELGQALRDLTVDNK